MNGRSMIKRVKRGWWSTPEGAEGCEVVSSVGTHRAGRVKKGAEMAGEGFHS